MNVKFIHATPGAEKHIAYCARVSNPANQTNQNIEKLLAYCIREKHWSIFQMASLCLEVQTSRAVSTQIIRHRSLHIQEFSQRYSAVTNNEIYEARRQDNKNRQNSIDDMSQETKDWFLDAQTQVWDTCYTLYQEGLSKSIAKEQMRFLLPLSTSTTLYINGTLRDWITYLLVRLDKSTQLEHREVAQGCWKIFQEQFPVISKSVKETYPEIFK